MTSTTKYLVGYDVLDIIRFSGLICKKEKRKKNISCLNFLQLFPLLMYFNKQSDLRTAPSV